MKHDLAALAAQFPKDARVKYPHGRGFRVGTVIGAPTNAGRIPVLLRSERAQADFEVYAKPGKLMLLGDAGSAA